MKKGLYFLMLWVGVSGVGVGQATLVKDIFPLKGSGGVSLTQGLKLATTLGNNLYFGASDGDYSYTFRQLWKTDGTEQGTQQIDLSKVAPPKFFVNTIFSHNRIVYFEPASSGYMFGLWRTDGTPQGTNRTSDKQFDESLFSYIYSNPRTFPKDSSLYFLTFNSLIRMNQNQIGHATVIFPEVLSSLTNINNTMSSFGA